MPFGWLRRCYFFWQLPTASFFGNSKKVWEIEWLVWSIFGRIPVAVASLKGWTGEMATLACPPELTLKSLMFTFLPRTLVPKNRGNLPRCPLWFFFPRWMVKFAHKDVEVQKDLNTWKKKQDGSKTGHTQVTLIKYREEIFDISWATAYLFRVLKLWTANLIFEKTSHKSTPHF